MATMLMQGTDLVTPEKMFSPLMRSRFEAGRGIEIPKPGPGLQRGSEGGRFRSRKGKNVQKKQPQRGLGVAQLEKIRLQEQSKHEAACLASLQYLRGMPSFSPSVTLGDHREAMRFPSPLEKQLRAGSLHALRQVEDRKAFGVLGSPGSGSSNKTADGKAQGYEFGNVPMPFTADHSTLLPYTRPGHGSSLSILISRQREFESPLSCLPYAQGLTGLKLGGAFRENANTSCAQQRKSEMDVIYELETDNLSPISLSSSNVMRKSKAGGCVSRTKYPETGDILLSSHDSSKSKDGPPLTLGIFDPSEPPGLHPSKQDFVSMPATLGISSVGQRPKELSSFQNYPGNQVWSDEDKTSTLKRKWLSMQENPAIFAMFLDSRAGIEVSDSKREKFYPYKNPYSPEIRSSGAHYTTGIVRNALGSSQWSQTKAKYDTAASDWLGASNRFQNSKGSSRDNHSPLSDILQSHVIDGDSSKSSLTNRFLAEDATFNAEASSGEFLALKLSIPYSISGNETELDSPENKRVNTDLDLKRDYTSSPRNSTTGAQGDFLLTAKLFKRESADYKNAYSWNLSANEQNYMSTPYRLIQSEQLLSQGSPCQQPTSPSPKDFENSSTTLPAANTLKPIDLSLKLAL